MFLRRKSGSFIAAFCLIATLWYFYTNHFVFSPSLRFDGTPEVSVTEKPVKQEPLPAQTSSAPVSQGGYKLEPQAEKPTANYPVTSLIPLPTGKPTQFVKLQHDFGPESPAEKEQRLNRQAAVKASFVHSWEGYKKHAWLKDELTPVTGGFIQSFSGWAATLVDSLDTLWMMGMKDEFEEALNSLDAIDFGRTDAETVNIFETTIRYMGGFLGAYDISGGKYPKLLEKALEVGNLIYGCFDTPNRMPVTRWKWKDPLLGIKQQAGENTLIAELGSLTLEFTRLSHLTGDSKFYDAIARITNALQEAQPKTSLPGLWPTSSNARKLVFDETSYTLGGMADSTYEYLPKQHLLLGGLNTQYKEMYEAAIKPIQEHIFFRPTLPDNPDILISGNVRSTRSGTSEPVVRHQSKGQHLACFTGGMVGMGAKMFNRPNDLSIARKLVDGCIWAYNHTQTGIMPEIFMMQRCKDTEKCEWDAAAYHDAALTEIPGDSHSQKIQDKTQKAEYLLKENRIPLGFTAIPDRRYILRPEAIESVFILYRLTGDKTLQDAAWQMYTQIEKYTRTDLANAAIQDVTVEQPKKDDRMESFWLAETLKYFYAIFSEPDVLDLDEFVL